MKTELIKQKNSWSCLACCACMATNTPLNQLYDFLGHDGSDVVQQSDHPEGRKSFSLIEIIKYMLNCGVISSFLSCNKKIAMKDVISSCIPAIIIIASNVHVKNGTHAIYWDGTNLMCPRKGLLSSRTRLKRVVIVLPLINIKEIGK